MRAGGLPILTYHAFDATGVSPRPIPHGSPRPSRRSPAQASRRWTLRPGSRRAVPRSSGGLPSRLTMDFDRSSRWPTWWHGIGPPRRSSWSPIGSAPTTAGRASPRMFLEGRCSPGRSLNRWGRSGSGSPRTGARTCRSTVAMTGNSTRSCAGRATRSNSVSVALVPCSLTLMVARTQGSARPLGGTSPQPSALGSTRPTASRISIRSRGSTPFTFARVASWIAWLPAVSKAGFGFGEPCAKVGGDDSSFLLEI